MVCLKFSQIGAGKPKVTHADDYSLVQVRDEDTLALPPPGHSATIGDRYDGNYCGEVGNNCGAKTALPNGLGGGWQQLCLLE